jgi:hypothetical protein
VRMLVGVLIAGRMLVIVGVFTAMVVIVIGMRAFGRCRVGIVFECVY